jgi:predicted ATP-binding protein involved in virulence
MQIKNFEAIGMNGYQNISITFKDNLSFVTGINGSGKTSCLNSMIALLMPRLDFLSVQTFQRLSLRLHHERKTVELSAEKDDGQTILQCSLTDGRLALRPFEPAIESGMPMHRAAEYEVEYYREMHASNIDNPVLKFINDLPTPMYLGLDRRIISIDDNVRFAKRASYSRPMRQRRRNIFGASLQQSLYEAIDFTEDKFRDVSLEKAKQNEAFQREIILDLLDFPPISFHDIRHLPNASDIKRLERAKKNLTRLPELISIEESDVKKRLDPFFEFLEERIARLPKSSNANRKNKGLDVREEELEARIEWSFNQSHIEKVNKLSEKISAHNKKIEGLEEKINQFLSSINSFFEDSGKRVLFTQRGVLRFLLEHDEDKEARPLPTLSSGEIQILVILAHLHFNPEAREAGVFMIDEPELSLHVQWQEKFIDEMVRAAPDLQYILATHSPSIIQEKTNQCIDISRP